MLTNLAFFRAKQGQTKSLGKALTDLVDPSRQEDGCISYDVHQSLQDADSWFVYENWRTTADLDAHMQKPHTAYGFAWAVEEGASEAGADVRLRKVRELAPEEAIASNQGWAAHRLDSQHVVEATLDDLVWADALVFGTPTRHGLPTAQLKQFLDTTGPLWANGALVNKICSAFTSSGTVHGGQETTIVNVNTTFYHWGAIIVGPGFADPIQFKAGNPNGASFTSNNGALKPDEIAPASARFQGRRITELATSSLPDGRMPSNNFVKRTNLNDDTEWSS